MEYEKLITALRKVVGESREGVRLDLEEKYIFKESDDHNQTFSLKDDSSLMPDLTEEGLYAEISDLVKWLNTDV